MPSLSQTAFILSLYALRVAAQCLPESPATDQTSCLFNNGNWMVNDGSPATCNMFLSVFGGTVSDLAIMNVAPGTVCCNAIPPYAELCSGYRTCSYVIQGRVTTSSSGCNSGDTQLNLPNGVYSAKSWQQVTQNYPGVTVDRLYTKTGYSFCADRIFWQSNDMPPVLCIDNSPRCAASTTQVTTKTTPAAGQCLSGDTGTTLTSQSTCDALTQNGSSLYVRTGTFACCDSIPSGTFVCSTPPPCAQVVPTNAAATSGCLAGDVPISISTSTTCDVLALQNAITTTDLYTTASSNICCSSIPVGSTICMLPTITTPTTTNPPSTPSNVDQYNDWEYVGCFVDSVAARTLPNPMALTGGTTQVTVELCIEACNGAGYKYAGLEWSQECYCGNTVPPEPATDGRCDMSCSGNPLQYCGGADGLSVYQNTNPNLPTTAQTYGDWSYSNCYVDSVENRVLPLAMQVPGGAAAMTVELCLNACQAAGYAIAGVEWSQECYCGSALPTTIAASGRCDMICDGNPLEYCGGGDAINVYSYTGTLTTSGPSNVATYKAWTFGGCYEDSVANRVLPVVMNVPGGGDAMTVESCLDACSAAGFAYGGVEWSRECYCGTTAPPTLATAGTCDMACTGNSQELCGGGDGISVYSSAAPASILQSYNSWTYTGCFEDSVDARSMPITVNTIASSSMTVEKCLDACNALGHSYAGLEYSQECYCADVLPATEATDDRCSMPCRANDSEYCGGGNGLTTYSYSYTPVYLSRNAA